MRTIHPVPLSEKFVASGLYRHYADDKPMGLVEHWSIHEQADGGKFIRVDVDGREHNGWSHLIEAYVGAESKQIERFDVHAYGPKGFNAKAAYTLEDGKVLVGRSVKAEPREYAELDMPDGGRLFPYSTLFYGWVSKSGEDVAVFNRPDAQEQRALKPDTVSHNVKLSNDVIDGKPARRVDMYLADWEDEVVTTVWLNAEGIPVRLQPQLDDMSVAIVLERYAHR